MSFICVRYLDAPKWYKDLTRKDKTKTVNSWPFTTVATICEGARLCAYVGEWMKENPICTEHWQCKIRSVRACTQACNVNTALHSIWSSVKYLFIRFLCGMSRMIFKPPWRHFSRSFSSFFLKGAFFLCAIFFICLCLWKKLLFHC